MSEQKIWNIFFFLTKSNILRVVQLTQQFDKKFTIKSR